ncbi:hypothetical protein EVAR_26845_1 [Eumeta japonica]|uniref:Uncharacterized protein n=1 Tax=Eumeta variegata TaxID=151549 RepID=A0A4C1VX47_EUMVA|nr:hypothetical protein EVAR_26845_1 [Eumeta japonica]
MPYKYLEGYIDLGQRELLRINEVSSDIMAKIRLVLVVMFVIDFARSSQYNVNWNLCYYLQKSEEKMKREKGGRISRLHLQPRRVGDGVAGNDASPPAEWKRPTAPGRWCGPTTTNTSCRRGGADSATSAIHRKPGMCIRSPLPRDTY